MHWPSLCGYGGLLLLNVLIVYLSFAIEDEMPRDWLSAPLQYVLWPVFLICPYYIAVWKIHVSKQLAWPKSIRVGIGDTGRAQR